MSDLTKVFAQKGHIMPESGEMTPVFDDWQPSDEDIKEHWTGEGHLVFHVLSHTKGKEYIPYEIDWDDYSGCVGGLDESLGIDYAVNEGILDVGKLHIGVTYEVKGITAHFTSGDGWTTDDDVDYYVESVQKIIYPGRFISAWWWHLIGHRIRNWKAK